MQQKPVNTLVVLVAVFGAVIVGLALVAAMWLAFWFWSRTSV